MVIGRMFGLEAKIQMTAIIVILILTIIGEKVIPMRKAIVSIRSRWPANFGVGMLNAVGVRLLLPAGLTGIAMIAESKGWGMMREVSIPLWAAVILGILLLDLIVYIQHMLFHKVGLLWLLHKVHHSDPDFDLSTGVRFHPIEMLISIGVKVIAVLHSGVPVLSVIIFETVLNSLPLFNHGNLKLPVALDSVLRRFIVTPDFHRVHHSVYFGENNRNYGFNLTWWDYIFRTYKPQPFEGHEEMSIGLDEYAKDGEMSFPRLIKLPFESKR